MINQSVKGFIWSAVSEGNAVAGTKSCRVGIGLAQGGLEAALRGLEASTGDYNPGPGG